MNPNKLRRFAQYTIISGVRQGLSGAAILRTLQNVGLGYRTENFYADYNSYLNKNVRLPRLTAQERATFVPDSYNIQVPARRSNTYQYIFSVPGRFADGRTEANLSITSAHRLTPDTALSLLEENQINFDKQSGGVLDFLRANLVGVNKYFSGFNA